MTAVAEGLAVKPVIRAAGQLRRASSSCCEARLNPGPEPETFTCRACGQPCDRVLGPPEEVTLNG